MSAWFLCIGIVYTSIPRTWLNLIWKGQRQNRFMWVIWKAFSRVLFISEYQKTILTGWSRLRLQASKFLLKLIFPDIRHEVERTQLCKSSPVTDKELFLCAAEVYHSPCSYFFFSIPSKQEALIAILYYGRVDTYEYQGKPNLVFYKAWIIRLPQGEHIHNVFVTGHSVFIFIF